MALAAASDYLVRVFSRLARFLLLLAMILMPLSMSHATASASHGVPRMGAMSGMVMAEGHCPDGTMPHGGKAMPGECTMACASALPAVEHPRPAVRRLTRARLEAPAPERLTGILLDIATPPPRG